MPKIIARNGHATTVQVSADEVRDFNRMWPCSELRPDRVSGYWFEFENASQDLIDTDVPEQDDGSAASAMSDDCKRWAFDDSNTWVADWMDDDDMSVQAAYSYSV